MKRILSTVVCYVIFANFGFSQSTPVTFSVDMRIHARVGVFDPESDIVDIAGSFNGWGSGASNILSDTEADTIYEITMSIGLGNIDYKYRINQTWDTHEDNIDNRTYTVVAGSNIIPTVIFNDGVFPQTVTFSVDMRTYAKTSLFDPINDLIDIVGSFNGWGGITYLLSDVQNDTIYEGTFNIPVGSIEYLFRINQSWDATENRVLGNRQYEVLAGANVIPIVLFNNGYFHTTALHIPNYYTTIQAGIDAAVDGDTVLVQPGTYYENIFWPETNGIKLISAGDSSNTIIDGGGISSVIYMNPQTAIIDTTTLIQGFKITNGGNVASGGGLFISSAAPLIDRVSIRENSCTSTGGGLYSDGQTIIRSSSISNNSAPSKGGGAFLLGGTMLDNLVISGNTGKNRGGGLHISRYY